MSESSKHPTTEELSAFSLGRLTPEVAQSVEDHVSDCLSCCETIVRLSAEDTFVDLLQEVGPSQADQQTSMGSAVADDGDALPSPLLDHPRYEIQSLIGRGGMGRVYRARHRMMDRAVALKVINREWVRQPEVIDRFRREVKTAASLDHRNIVTAHDAEHAGDTHFLVMEFVEGVDLAETVRQRGPLPVSEACEYIRQAAVGLEYAHTRGMVHRDIKPHNLIVTQERVVKILDFGLASLTPQATPEEPVSEDADGNLTIAGAIMGTPDFISPEQAQDAHQVDGRSDIYSLGMTLYYLLAGRVPFAEGSATDKLKQHAEAEPPPLGEIRDDVPAALQHVIAQMTAKQRADRLQSPEEVGAALAAFIDETSVPANVADPQPAPVPIAEVRAGRRGWKVLSSLALGGLLALACVMYQQWNSPERDRDRLDAFLATGQSSEPAGDILRRLLRSDAGRSYLRKLDAKYPKLAYTDGDFSPGYTQVAALAYVNRETGVPEPDLLVIGSSTTTSGMHQRGLPKELIIKSVEFDSADDDTCQAIFTLITLDETEFMELRTGSVYESRIGIKDLLGQNGRNSRSLFDAFVAGSYQRKATVAEATASQWEFQRDLKAPPAGERPAVSPLIDRTLTGIRNNAARWVFTWDKVTITSAVPGQPLPADVVWEVLESDGQHQKIHASWQLMNRNQQVELFNIKVDDEASPREVRLPFAAAGNIRVNLGSHQYNCRPTSQLAAAELSPGQMTELQTGGGKRVDQIAEAVCRAAGVSIDQWEWFMKDRASQTQNVGDPLSLVLPQPLSTLAGQPPAQLSDLRAAMSLSVSRGYYSLLQPQYITDLSYRLTPENGKATLQGRVCFNGLGLYAGRVNFKGRVLPVSSTAPAEDPDADIRIEITQFSAPAAGSIVTRGDDGLWQLSKVAPSSDDAFGDDYDLSFVPAAAIEVHGFSPRRLHADGRFVRLMKHLAISPMNWATLFDGRVEQALVVKLGSGEVGAAPVIGLLTIGEGTALEFARSLAPDAFSDAPPALQLSDALRRPAQPCQGRHAFRILDARTVAIGEPEDLNQLTKLQAEPRDGEFVAASATFNKRVHQAFSLARPMDTIWLQAMMQESPESLPVSLIMPHLPLVTDCSSLAVTLTLNDRPRLALHIRVPDSSKLPVMTKSLQELVGTLTRLSQRMSGGGQREGVQWGLQLGTLAKAVLQEALRTATVTNPTDSDARLSIPLQNVEPQLRPFIESLLTARTSRESVENAISANQLKQLAVAFLLFEQDHGYLPSVRTKLPDAKYPVSWRVAILPYLGEDERYRQYDLNQPWHSEHNKKLLQSTPTVYRHPSLKRDTGRTNYVTIAGADTATGDGQTGLTMDDVQSGDDPHRTVLLAECTADIPWTSPEDRLFEPGKPVPTLGGIFSRGFQVAMVDGSVHPIAATVSDEQLTALLTRNGNELVDLDLLRAAFEQAGQGMPAVRTPNGAR